MNRGSNADPIFQRELGRDYPTIDRGKGIHLYDTAGKRYLDMMGAYSAVSHGHLHPRLVAAAHRQLERVAVTSRSGGGGTSTETPRRTRSVIGRAAPNMAEIDRSGMALPRVRGAYVNKVETKNGSRKFQPSCGMNAKR